MQGRWQVVRRTPQAFARKFKNHTQQPNVRATHLLIRARCIEYLHHLLQQTHIQWLIEVEKPLHFANAFYKNSGGRTGHTPLNGLLLTKQSGDGIFFFLNFLRNFLGIFWRNFFPSGRFFLFCAGNASLKELTFLC